jgi:hypothetical protein
MNLESLIINKLQSLKPDNFYIDEGVKYTRRGNQIQVTSHLRYPDIGFQLLLSQSLARLEFAINQRIKFNDY